MRISYIKPEMLIEFFDIEDVITASSGIGGGDTPGGGDNPSGSDPVNPGHDGEETFAVPGGEIIGSNAAYDAQVIGGNELQENLENLYQNMIKDF